MRPITFALCLLAICFVVFSGCAQLGQMLDRTAAATTQAADGGWGVIGEVADGFPFGRTALEAFGALAGTYLFLRGRKWKSAFATVVKSVEPYIPADEEARAEIKEVQGAEVTALVKAVK